jgi:SAM-dependent methyltransferase
MPPSPERNDYMSSDFIEKADKCREDWDARARENPRYYIATGHTDWDREAFVSSGEATVAGEILTDMQNICQGAEPASMNVLEIGCGLGRVTRALAKVFGHIYAIDISGEMIAQARSQLGDLSNVHLYQNNGYDLSVLPCEQLHFAYSTIVFQHIPSREMIEKYCSEVHRLLRPGGLFKFQVQGGAMPDSYEPDSWLGVSFSEEQAHALARNSGFELRYHHGAGTQYFWLWFFKIT